MWWRSRPRSRGCRLFYRSPGSAATSSAPEADRSSAAEDDGIRYLTKHPDEILTEVRLPAQNGWDATYWKLRRRGSVDFPVLGVAAWIRWENGLAADARIVLGGVASSPQPIPEASAALVGTALEDTAVDAAADAAYRPAKPMDNTDFGLAWRKEMTRVYVKGALEELRGRAGRG